MPKQKDKTEQAEVPAEEAPGEEEATTPGDERLDAVAAPVESEQTPEEAAAAQMAPPAQAFEPAQARPEGVCVNCGEESQYRTTTTGAEPLEFCEAHRPEEGVEQIIRRPADADQGDQPSDA